MQTQYCNKTDELLDDSKLAELLKVTERTIRLWRKTRALPYIRLTAKVIRYRWADIEKWLARHAVVTGCRV